MDLKPVLQGCLSQDNEVRKQAEEALEAAKGRPDAVPSLASEACTSENVHVRLLAALVLKKWLPSTWPELSPEHQAQLKDALRTRSIEEPTTSVRASLVECVAGIAEHELPEDRWSDLLPFLNQCTQSPTAEHRASSVTLFKALAESVPAFLAPHFPALQAVCMKGLRDDSDIVRRASLFAVSGILGLAGADKTHTALLQELMSPTIDVLEACISASISSGSLDDAHNGISLLLEIIEEPLPLLAQCLPRIVRLSLTTTCSNKVELELRNHASQILAWLATFKPKQLARSAAVPEIVQQLCTLATEPDPPDFDASNICQEALPPRKVATQALDTLALGMPSKLVAPAALEFVERGLQQPDTAARVAACSVLAVLSEGCADTLRARDRFAALLPAVTKCTADADPGVRAAAATCIGEMASHLQPEMSEHCGVVMPALVAALQSERDSTIVERVAFGLDNSMEHLEEEALAQYLPAVMPPLLALLHAGDRRMHDTLLSCVSSAASAGGDAFKPFAAPVIEHLQRFMAITAPDALSARTAATECVGLVAETLGRAVAEKLLPPFLHAAAQGFQLHATALREYGHGLFAVSARLLEDAFVPYLQGAFDMAVASIESTDAGILGEAVAADGGESDGADGVSLSQVRTGIVDEKAAALQAVGLYAAHTGAAFLPYAEKALQLCKEMAEHLHADPRAQAMEALPRIVVCIHGALPPEPPAALSEPATAALGMVLPLLFSAVSNDYERPVVASAITALGALCSGLPGGSLAHVAPALVEAIESVLTGASTCQAASDDDDDDDDDFADMQDAEEALLEATADAIVTLAPSFGASAFMDAWKAKLGQPFLSWLQPSRTDSMRSVFVGTLAELLPHMGDLAAPYVPAVLPILLKETQCETPQNRHHALFAIGTLMERCSSAMQAGAAVLVEEVIAPALRDPAPSVRDNACGALARALVAHPASLPQDRLLQELLAALPIRRDFDEAAPVVDALTRLMLDDAAVAAAGGAAQPPQRRISHPGCLSGCVHALAALCCQTAAPMPVRERASAAVHALHGCAPAEVQHLVQALPADQQAMLQQLMPPPH